MAVLSLVLYGSCAREDNDESSDVDLFAITDDSFYRMSIQNKANMACYPKDYAELRAKSGDLFFWHLILEGKVLYDPDGYFELIKASFQKKPSYDLEINNAKDIAWMLVDLCDSTEEYVMINKRIAWCVRTILIAKSASFGTPVFSKKQLIEFCDDSSVRRILSNKESFFRNSNAASDLEVFLKRFGLFRSQDGRSRDDYMELFRSRDNRMGIKTLSAVINGAGLSDYL